MQLKNSLTAYLSLPFRVCKFFVLFVCIGGFSSPVQSSLITRQKQRVVALVKKHPVVASIIIASCIAWSVYKMSKNDLDVGQLLDPFGIGIFLRSRYCRWRGDLWAQPWYQQAERLREQRQREADLRNPQPPSVSYQDALDRERDWREFEAEQRSKYGMLYSEDFPRWRAVKYGGEGPFIPTFILTDPLVNQVAAPAQNDRFVSSSSSSSSSFVPPSRREVEAVNNGGKAFEHFEAVLKKGTALEQNNLGSSYRYGRNGLKADPAKAVALFRAAADKKFAIAQDNLGFCYLNGIGVARDDSEAFKLFELAAAQGEVSAQFNLGFCYLDGRGVRKNLLKALAQFRTAAGNGDLEAQILMYHILHRGILVPKDDILAHQYFDQIKKDVGSEAAARKKLAEDDSYKRFMQSSTSMGCAGEPCSICQEVFQQGDWLSILPCQHFFCQACLARWVKMQNQQRCAPTCPCCRRVFQQQQIIAGTAI